MSQGWGRAPSTLGVVMEPCIKNRLAQWMLRESVPAAWLDLVKEPRHSVPSLAGRSAMTLRHELAALGLL